MRIGNAPAGLWHLKYVNNRKLSVLVIVTNVENTNREGLHSSFITNPESFIPKYLLQNGNHHVLNIVIFIVLTLYGSLWSFQECLEPLFWEEGQS